MALLLPCDEPVLVGMQIPSSSRMGTMKHAFDAGTPVEPGELPTCRPIARPCVSTISDPESPRSVNFALPLQFVAAIVVSRTISIVLVPLDAGNISAASAA